MTSPVQGVMTWTGGETVQFLHNLEDYSAQFCSSTDRQSHLAARSSNTLSFKMADISTNRRKANHRNSDIP